MFDPVDTLALAGVLDNVDGSTEVDAPAGGDADLAGDPCVQEMAHEFADALTDELRNIVFQEHRARFRMPNAECPSDGNCCKNEAHTKTNIY